MVQRVYFLGIYQICNNEMVTLVSLSTGDIRISEITFRKSNS